MFVCFKKKKWISLLLAFLLLYSLRAVYEIRQNTSQSWIRNLHKIPEISHSCWKVKTRGRSDWLLFHIFLWTDQLLTFFWPLPQASGYTDDVCRYLPVHVDCWQRPLWREFLVQAWIPRDWPPYGQGRTAICQFLWGAVATEYKAQCQRDIRAVTIRQVYPDIFFFPSRSRTKFRVYIAIQDGCIAISYVPRYIVTSEKI